VIDALPIEQDSFSAAQLGHARASAAQLGCAAVDLLEQQSRLEPARFVACLARTLHYRVLVMDELNRLDPAFDLLPFAEASARHCVALRDAHGGIILAMADPLEPSLAGWASERIACAFSWALAHRTDLAAWLARHEETMRAMDGLDNGAGPAAVADGLHELSFQTISADTSPVVKLVHSTLYDALKLGASDIHLETAAAGLTIKYRIDGVLSVVARVAGLDMAEQVLSRVKVMSELDIAERRVPQDGRFKVSVRQRQVDFRVSVMPSIFGEDAVLRVLDKQALSDQMKGLRLDLLGFDPAAVDMLRQLSRVPYGMVLVTGPTGSGKTTTLYAAITEINCGLDKIITIEDPVEYQLPGVLQIPVNEKKGLTFARGLRSILRHDPDKIMVGEIRDPETAQIAVQSALTGHLVFTTVHANNVFDVIGRFIHMGVDPYSFVSALNGILAQRLVRVSCTHCAVAQHPGDELLAESGLGAADAARFAFRAASGCGHCRGTGFKGRKAIGEVLLLNDEIRELIVARAPGRLIRDAAARNGTRLLREIALDMVACGETTLQEINRVTFVAR
jgi:general secretion pathway protein E